MHIDEVIRNYLHDLNTKHVCQLWQELEYARLEWLLNPACGIDGCLICGDLDPDNQDCTCDLEGWDQ